MPHLPDDSRLTFPHVFVIPASAGSGKTYTLAHRYVQFLLSPLLPSAGIRNILAITFTKLAAKEMKERIVRILKEAAMKHPATLAELSGLVSLPPERIAERAELLVEQILRNYSDFNVRTIDSFLSTIYKASAMELGVPPNVQIDFDHDAMIDRAFRNYSRTLREGSAELRLFDELITVIDNNDSASKGFLWNPYSKIVREVRELHRQFGRFALDPIRVDGTERLSALKESITVKARTLEKLLRGTTLPVSKHYLNDVSRLAAGEVYEIAYKAKKTKYFNKYSDDDGAAKEIKKLFAVIRPLEEELEEYVTIHAHTYYQPFVQAVSLIASTLREVKMLEGSVVMDDINRSLARSLSSESVPEVYIKLGERISHFMIDEFQDTSPIQWKNLHVLIEEALSKGGSIFAVGDTKQSIYGFRGGDWKIFKALIDGKYFPSAPVSVIPLETNYRSAHVLVDFVKEVFSTNVAAAGLRDEADQSGLYQFAQEVPASERNKGYVEVTAIQKDDAETWVHRHRTAIISAVQDALQRGYTHGDIAILTPANADVVEISAWLNEAGIPFLSLSTLDIRKRKAIAELFALLKFLDSPIDGLSFATFVLGDLFRTTVEREGNREKRGTTDDLHQLFQRKGKESEYLLFQRHYPQWWERYFERLFALVGYLPLYDIVSESFKTFSVFDTLPSEESALVKLLECVKQFENSGNNSLKDFLLFSGEENPDAWSIDVPNSVHAVRIMTVHKSKGLGFPVVIVSLKEKRPPSQSLMTVETEQGLSVLRVSKNSGEWSETLGSLHRQKEQERTIDELNKIYVALTRARKEMYVVSVFKNADNLPASILPPKTYGKKYERAETAGPVQRLPLLPSLHRRSHAPLPVARYERIGVAETERGDRIHRILAQLEFLADDVEREVQRAVTMAGVEADGNTAAERELLLQFLSSSDVREYFERRTGRAVFREQDIVAGNGRLYRMDRVIVDPTAVCVVDFKTGSDDHHAEYEEQVRNYMELLREISPGVAVTGALLYVDLRKGVPIR